MAIKKVGMVFFALLLLIASPLAYASNGETDSGISTVNGLGGLVTGWFGYYYYFLPGTYTWVDHSASDNATERGYFLHLERPQFQLIYGLTAIEFGSPLCSGQAIYGVYEKNPGDTLDNAAYTNMYYGTWYPQSSDTIHLGLNRGSYVYPPISLPWLPVYDVFDGDLHVDIQNCGIYNQATISLFGNDLVKTIVWPIILYTDVGTESYGV